MGVVMAVMRRPPDWAALHGRGTEYGKRELRSARRLERAVGKIAMIEAGDREHAQRVQRHGGTDSDGADADPDHAQARQVHADERHDARPVDPVAGRTVARLRCRSGVEPLRQRVPGLRCSRTIHVRQDPQLAAVISAASGPPSRRMRRSLTTLRGSSQIDRNAGPNAGSST